MTRYVILSRNGYDFVAEGMDYAVYDKEGRLVFINANKQRVEEFFMRFTKAN